jgi:hypothetical protein
MYATFISISLGTTDDIKFSVTDQLIDAKNARCLICLDKVTTLSIYNSLQQIRVDAPTWQCNQCYCLLHLGCIRSWIQNRAPDKAYTLTAESFPLRKQTAPWMCPKCRSEYTHAQIPIKYFCFCGKEEDPEYNVWAPPHSVSISLSNYSSLVWEHLWESIKWKVWPHLYPSMSPWAMPPMPTDSKAVMLLW